MGRVCEAAYEVILTYAVNGNIGALLEHGDNLTTTLDFTIRYIFRQNSRFEDRRDAVSSALFDTKTPK